MRIIKLPEVRHQTSLGRSTIYRMMAAGTFPAQVTLNERSVGWVESEIQDWLQKRIDDRDDNQ